MLNPMQWFRNWMYAKSLRARLNDISGSGTSLDTDIQAWQTNEFGKYLIGPKAVKTYNDALRHPVIGAIDRAYSLTLANSTYEIEASHVRTKTFIEENLGIVPSDINNLNFTSLVDDGISRAHRYGYSYLEHELDIQDGKVILKDVIALPCKSIVDYETEGSQLKYIVQQQKGKPVEIPAEKLSVFVYRKNGNNYYGESLFYSAYRSLYHLQEIERLDLINHIRHAIGIAIASWRGTSTKPTEEDKKAVEKILKDMQSGELSSILNLNEWQYDILGKDRAKATDLPASWNRCVYFILVSTLVNLLTIGSPLGSGSYSASETFDKILFSAVGYSGKIQTEGLQNLIDQLVQANFPSNHWARLIVRGIDPEIQEEIEEEEEPETPDDSGNNQSNQGDNNTGESEDE